MGSSRSPNSASLRNRERVGETDFCCCGGGSTEGIVSRSTALSTSKARHTPSKQHKRSPPSIPIGAARHCRMLGDFRSQPYAVRCRAAWTADSRVSVGASTPRRCHGSGIGFVETSSVCFGACHSAVGLKGRFQHIATSNCPKSRNHPRECPAEKCGNTTHTNRDDLGTGDGRDITSCRDYKRTGRRTGWHPRFAICSGFAMPQA
jgi:hypothetical protein